MKSNLQPYGNTNDINIEVLFELAENTLFIFLIIQGELDGYLFPKTSKPQRANELWKSTCFELFLASSEKEEYYELNFSSSLAWNFYVLKDYRAETKELKLLNEPIIRVFEEEDSFKIELELEGFDCEAFDVYNPTCILLTKDNERTFWSPKKMKGKPDFHDRKYFLKIGF